MRTVLGILRRRLNIVGWIGCGVSALLLVATVLLWVRSFARSELWDSQRFEPRPDWRTPELAGKGTRRVWSVQAIHGRLWVGSGT